MTISNVVVSIPCLYSEVRALFAYILGSDAAGMRRRQERIRNSVFAPRRQRR
jgi:hypothetical protein